VPDNDFADAARALVLDLTDVAVKGLLAYRDLLAASAREFNLTSVREPEAIERRHLLESLAFGRLIEQHGLLPEGAKVLDVGTGAGLPGLPLKLAWPSLRMTLMEATGKKCRFLELVIARLGLEGIDVVEARAEELAHDPKHRAAYDLVVARAVAPLPVLLEYTLPYLRLGGHLAATKGSAARSELEASTPARDALGGAIVATPTLETPEGLPQTVVIIEKVRETPERYPRRTGIPTKRPIQ
jgi:16S rRNA (guanine527-N7)-methyltransferase